MKKLLLFVLVFSIHFTVQAADDFSTLEERMTGKDFKETGLGKLSDAELAALNEWLKRHSVGTLESASASSGASGAVAAADGSAEKDMRGFENQPKIDKSDRVIYSTVVGKFDGWRAEGTLFKLANGMIWQQSESDTFYMPELENPEITVTKGFMNSWSFSVVGHNSKVSVKRIQ